MGTPVVFLGAQGCATIMLLLGRFVLKGWLRKKATSFKLLKALDHAVEKEVSNLIVKLLGSENDAAVKNLSGCPLHLAELHAGNHSPTVEGLDLGELRNAARSDNQSVLWHYPLRVDPGEPIKPVVNLR